LIPTFIDFESQSRADLKRVGGRRYWDDPSTVVLCCVLHHPQWGRVKWWPARGPLFTLSDPPLECVAAHNWETFDRHAWARLGWPTPVREVDTSIAARRAGIGGSLAKLGALVGRDVKDKEGSRFTVGLSTVRKPTLPKARPEDLFPHDWAAAGRGERAVMRAAATADTRARRQALNAAWKEASRADKRRAGVLPDVSSEDLARVVEYCGHDVDALVDAWPLIAPFADVELDVQAVDRVSNDRGITVDLPLVRALLDVDRLMAREAAESVGVSLTDLASNVKFPALVRALGADCPNAQFETVEELTRHGDARVRDLAEARLSTASIAKGKLEAALARTSDDGRMRDNMRPIAAHTWRYAGSGFQCQNIPWIDKRA